jgi:hypothetical protein
MLDKIFVWYPESEFLKLEGFDTAVIGIYEQEMKLIYSSSRIIEILQDQMSEEDAVEFFDFNIKYAYYGEKTPIICIDDL